MLVTLQFWFPICDDDDDDDDGRMKIVGWTNPLTGSKIPESKIWEQIYTFHCFFVLFFVFYGAREATCVLLTSSIDDLNVLL